MIMTSEFDNLIDENKLPMNLRPDNHLPADLIVNWHERGGPQHLAIIANLKPDPFDIRVPKD